MQIGVDIGGTFTDIVALDRGGRLVLAKVPSTPKDLLEGIAAATTTVLRLAGAKAGDHHRMQVWAGQSAAMGKTIPAGQMIRAIWDEAQALL